MIRRAAPLVLLALPMGCDLDSTLPVNLPPLLIEADPPEGEALTAAEGGIAVFIVVTDEDPETLTETWLLVGADGTETPLEGEPFTPSYETSGDDYALFAQSFSALSIEPEDSLQAVITDIKGDSLVVSWPLVVRD